MNNLTHYILSTDLSKFHNLGTTFVGEMRKLSEQTLQYFLFIVLLGMDIIIDKNIILMGPPGGGKTTSAKMIAERLRLKSVDVDDDILEPTWSCPVSDKLRDVGIS